MRTLLDTKQEVALKFIVAYAENYQFQLSYIVITETTKPDCTAWNLMLHIQKAHIALNLYMLTNEEGNTN